MSFFELFFVKIFVTFLTLFFWPLFCPQRQSWNSAFSRHYFITNSYVFLVISGLGGQKWHLEGPKWPKWPFWAILIVGRYLGFLWSHFCMCFGDFWSEASSRMLPTKTHQSGVIWNSAGVPKDIWYCVIIGPTWPGRPKRVFFLAFLHF